MTSGATAFGLLPNSNSEMRNYQLSSTKRMSFYFLAVLLSIVFIQVMDQIIESHLTMNAQG